MLDTPPRMRPPEPGAPFEYHLVWPIELAIKLVGGTGTPPIASGPCAFWRPIGKPGDETKRRAAKKAVGRGNPLPSPYPPLTEPIVFDPQLAVSLLARGILQGLGVVEAPPLVPYPEPAEPKSTWKPPRETVFAAVERKAKKLGVAYFTPALHDVIEHVYHALMAHNIAASQTPFFHALKLSKHPHRHDAEDLSQRTKEKLLNWRIDGWAVPNALMRTTCHNLFLNDCEKRAHEAEDATGYIVDNKLAVPATQDWYEETVEHWLTLADLPLDTQTLLIRRARGDSYKELALYFGCPIGTVGSRLSAAYKQLRKGKRPHFDTPTCLPIGLISDPWIDPNATGDGCRRKFDPTAGFGGAPSEQAEGGRLPGFAQAGVFEDDERLPAGSNRKFWEPPPPIFYRGIRRNPDPGRHIPTSLELNAYYKEVLSFAHWRNLAHRKGSACYFECGCDDEQPCAEWLVKYEYRPYKQDEPRQFPRHPDYVGTSLPRQIIRMFGPRYHCSECQCVIAPLKDCTDCVKCGAPAPFPPTPVLDIPYPPLPVLSLPSTRVQLHPKPSWRDRIASAWVDEYTPRQRSNLGAHPDDAGGVMDAIERGRELSPELQQWRHEMDGAEPSYMD